MVKRIVWQVDNHRSAKQNIFFSIIKVMKWQKKNQRFHITIFIPDSVTVVCELLTKPLSLNQNLKSSNLTEPSKASLTTVPFLFTLSEVSLCDSFHCIDIAEIAVSEFCHIIPDIVRVSSFHSGSDLCQDLSSLYIKTTFLYCSFYFKKKKNFIHSVQVELNCLQEDYKYINNIKI